MEPCGTPVRIGAHAYYNLALLQICKLLWFGRAETSIYMYVLLKKKGHARP